MFTVVICYKNAISTQTGNSSYFLALLDIFIAPAIYSSCFIVLYYINCLVLQHSFFHLMLNYIKCSCSFDHRAFRWMMTMVFAVEEINRNSSLLPGVKLGYRIMDSCDHVHTSLQALLSLVSHSEPLMRDETQMQETEKSLDILMNSRIEGEKIADRSETVPRCLKASEKFTKGNIKQERWYLRRQAESVPSCVADSPVPAVIGLASSSPTRAVAHTLGPFNIPLVRQEQKCRTVCTFFVHCIHIVLLALLD